ncbi:hypothetical protein KUCAC02_028152, partial [Chaenocephalus aceratus]
RCLCTIVPVDTITFHLEAELMCRCCYLLSDQKHIKSLRQKENEGKKKVQERWASESGLCEYLISSIKEIPSGLGEEEERRQWWGWGQDRLILK